MKPVNYDIQQYQNYARGRAMRPAQMTAWISAVASRLPSRRPLHGLDLGSGTGRFTPALAAAFGPVTGVEPAAKMRQIAEAEAAHPDVTYLSGSAEAIPMPDESVDYTLMFLTWHHVQDKARAADELARVTRPGGTLLLRSQFRDHMPRLWWLEYFPRGLEVDASMFESLAEVAAVLAGAGWELSDFAGIAEPQVGTRAEVLDQLRLRPFSIFERLTAEEVAVGFRRLEQAVAADPDAPAPRYQPTLLTLVRRGTSRTRQNA
jgi:ubiquinone/menaquinone biosynthesis C-methylase UbiE